MLEEEDIQDELQWQDYVFQSLGEAANYNGVTSLNLRHPDHVMAFLVENPQFARKHLTPMIRSIPRPTFLIANGTVNPSLTDERQIHVDATIILNAI